MEQITPKPIVNIKGARRKSSAEPFEIDGTTFYPRRWAANLLNISVQTLTNYIINGKVRSAKLGMVVISDKELTRFVKESLGIDVDFSYKAVMKRLSEKQ